MPLIAVEGRSLECVNAALIVPGTLPSRSLEGHDEPESNPLEQRYTGLRIVIARSMLALARYRLDPDEFFKFHKVKPQEFSFEGFDVGSLRYTYEDADKGSNYEVVRTHADEEPYALSFGTHRGEIVPHVIEDLAIAADTMIRLADEVSTIETPLS